MRRKVRAVLYLARGDGGMSGCFAQQFIPIGYAESEDVAYQMAQETPLKEVIQHCLRETEEYETLKAERDREKIEHTAEPQH